MNNILAKWRQKGGTQHPALSDPTEFLICIGLEENQPILKKVRKVEFPRSLIHSKLNAKLNRGIVKNFNCFYSGVECYWVSWKNFELEQRKLPWALNREHLVSAYNAGRFLRLSTTQKENNEGNIVYAGRYINAKIGHSPLPLKILIKRHLEKCEYDRTNCTYENALKIKQYLIEYEDQYKLGGLYPWQPWTYVVPAHKQAAEELHRRMLQIELEFLRVPLKEKRAWLENLSFNM
jgi:hypothetical protein